MKTTYWRDNDGRRFTACQYPDPASGLPCVDIRTDDGTLARAGLLMSDAYFREWATEFQGWEEER